jgi:4-hydroxybenzoate polyprenyltransferase
MHACLAAAYGTGMRQRLWSVSIVGLALGSLAMVGGTAIGGDVGPLAVGYGLLVALAALYMVIGLAVRERVWQHAGTHDSKRLAADRLAGRRIF